ncbi:alpha-L-fucosidase [Alloprevotella rava]|uniref:alpha-L-fucosidase n=1 Tax=Alloprevotella rava TaxID=671218 RepID=A0A7W5UIJ6_9BACT|nr:alpha-L-fucosidase [Alloprevotella rava]MBB3703171.1 alpha-L-fucosidase [Alloprevotella rava]
MKKIITAILLFSTLSSFAQTYYKPTQENIQSRNDFANEKFGIFLHWGLYSIFGQGEWYMTNENIDCHEYAKSAQAFYPHNFSAKKWVEAIKASGAKYITFTTRHHDGFSLWNTKQSDYNIMNTPYGKDIVKELADECHKQGIALHLYYSLLDWTREDYPLGRTGLGTKRKKASKTGNWPSYLQFMNNQLTELLSNYGNIRAIWFDGWWDHDEDSIPFDWQFNKLYDNIHRLQPQCLIGNNHHQHPFEGEDIQIFERDVPGENKAGLSGQTIGRLPLETCQTMNGMWGYKVKDQNYKTPKKLIQLLVKTSGKGANLLLNIGPQPDGNLPETALARLVQMGRWLKENGESIYGTTAGNIIQGDSIISTQKENILYLHFLSEKENRQKISIPFSKKVKKITTLKDHSKIPFKQKKGILDFEITIPKDNTDYILRIE